MSQPREFGVWITDVPRDGVVERAEVLEVIEQLHEMLLQVTG
jgi:hypothetical protein